MGIIITIVRAICSHKNKKVILMAQKKKTLDRHLETPVPDEIYEQLLQLLEEEGK